MIVERFSLYYPDLNGVSRMFISIWARYNVVYTTQVAIYANNKYRLPNIAYILIQYEI